MNYPWALTSTTMKGVLLLAVEFYDSNNAFVLYSTLPCKVSGRKLLTLVLPPRFYGTAVLPDSYVAIPHILTDSSDSMS